MSKEIGEKVEDLKNDCPYKLEFMPNEHNLGYDGNLGAIIQKCSGRYIFFMSDDDAFYEGALDVIVSFLKECKKDYGVLYAPFIYSYSLEKDRYHSDLDFGIPKGETNAANYVYDSILFSGLIFRKGFVSGYDASRFKNMNYFQVYMFLKMMYHHGGYYFAHPSVLCVGDGENAYGYSESSGGNKALQDRTSVISNLEFNKTLIKVIQIFDDEEDTHVLKAFEKQYSVHSYSGLSIARANGLSYFNQYWKKLNTVGVKLTPIVHLYHLALLLLGSKVCNMMTSGLRKRFKK